MRKNKQIHLHRQNTTAPIYKFHTCLQARSVSWNSIFLVANEYHTMLYCKNPKSNQSIPQLATWPLNYLDMEVEARKTGLEGELMGPADVQLNQQPAEQEVRNILEPDFPVLKADTRTR